MYLKISLRSAGSLPVIMPAEMEVQMLALLKTGLRICLGCKVMIL